MATKTKVLIVEDEKMLGEMYKTKFEMEGFAVDQALDGQEGIDTARKSKPDIILLDIIMPKLDGFIVLQELKKDDKTKDIPVILLTNLGQEDDVKRGKKLGASDYFVKANHSPADVVVKVKSIIKNK
ncbi:response regulator transcription factor [Patescibacteria group bacterium]